MTLVEVGLLIMMKVWRFFGFVNYILPPDNPGGDTGGEEGAATSLILEVEKEPVKDADTAIR